MYVTAVRLESCMQQTCPVHATASPDCDQNPLWVCAVGY